MPRRADNRKLMKLLMLTLGVLIVALIVVLIIMLAQGGSTGEDKQETFVESNKYLKGILIAGIDISGMTYDEAAAIPQLRELGKQAEDGFSYTFTVSGKEFTFTAAEIGATSGFTHTLKEAMLFGQFGSEAGAQRKELNENGGKSFEFMPYADIETVTAKLKTLKTTTLDTLPQDAALSIADDVKFDANAEYLYQLEGVTIVEEVVGVDVDADALAALICDDINNGTLAGVEAPVILTYPDLKVDELKANTKRFNPEPVTTSFDGSTDDRITNINILSGFVNGAVIQPGQTWSINEAAGPRNAQTAKQIGWAEAHGITNGRYEDQYGGGVCQVSGTLYNAALRAELTITERYPHSWPSTYLPEGLDATINYPSGELDSPGTKDLKLTNPYNMPVYLVAYVDNDAKTLTIQAYGPPLVHGYKVQYVNIKVGSEKAAPTEYHYDAATAPDGTPITAGKGVEWVEPHDGQTWQVWKQYVDEQGNVVKSEFFSESSYRSFQGVIYRNYANPLYAEATATTTG